MRDYKVEFEKRVNFIKYVLAESGAKGVVYGNSGGKDSALSKNVLYKINSLFKFNLIITHKMHLFQYNSGRLLQKTGMLPRISERICISQAAVMISSFFPASASVFPKGSMMAELPPYTVLPAVPQELQHTTNI